MIEVKNIYKSFGTLDVLKDVSLTVNKGEVVDASTIWKLLIKVKSWWMARFLLGNPAKSEK